MRGYPAQGEALAVWALLAADVLAVLVTYSVLDPSELYHVSRDGLDGGLSRALVQLNFPFALAAIPLVLLALDVLPPRMWLAGGPAVALCAVVAWPGVVEQSNLDAKAANALPALGVVIAFSLTVVAARRAGVRFAPWRRSDVLRVVVGAAVVLASLPWITAELGFHLPGGVFLTDQPYAEPGEPARATVHLGHHHGLAGMLLVLTALLLSRQRLVGTWLRRIYAALLAVMLTYGIANIVNDFWHEQMVKRGWTSWDVPSATEPRLNAIWALVLLAAGVVYALGFARRDEIAMTGDNQLR